MELEIRNVGKFSRAHLQVEGLTVLAGANSTGKSTLSKSLYCLFNGFNFNENEYISEKKSSAHVILKNLVYYSSRSNIVDYRNISNRLTNKLLNLKNPSINSIKELLEKEINKNQAPQTNIYRNYFGNDTIKTPPLSDSDIERIAQIISLNEKDFLKFKTTNLLSNEFHNQVHNLNHQEAQSIFKLTIQHESLSYSVQCNEIVDFKYPFVLSKNAIYIDDPFIVDDLSTYKFLSHENTFRGNHRENLCNLIKTNRNGSILDHIEINRYNDIMTKINKICTGELTKSQYGKFVYQEKNGAEIDLFNLSTGIKTFLIISTLLKNGTFEQNGTIILDEPEIHLHPEWQIHFAEILILLQKYFNLHILLTTHSPYFLNALETFSKKYDIVNKCHFYHTTSSNGDSILTEVTASVDTIYKEMAKPFQTLEDIAYE